MWTILNKMNETSVVSIWSFMEKSVKKESSGKNRFRKKLRENQVQKESSGKNS